MPIARMKLAGVLKKWEIFVGLTSPEEQWASSEFIDGVETREG